MFSSQETIIFITISILTEWGWKNTLEDNIIIIVTDHINAGTLLRQK